MKTPWSFLLVVSACCHLSLLTPLSAADALPVKRVVLFTSGVGFFQREGAVVGDASVELDLKVEVEPLQQGGTNELTSIQIRKGVMAVTHRRMQTKSYTIRDKAAEKRRVRCPTLERVFAARQVEGWTQTRTYGLPTLRKLPNDSQAAFQFSEGCRRVTLCA